MSWLNSPASDLCTLSWVIGLVPPEPPPPVPPPPPEPPPLSLSPSSSDPPSPLSGGGSSQTKSAPMIPVSKGTSTYPSGQKTGAGIAKQKNPPSTSCRKVPSGQGSSPVCAPAGKEEASRIVTRAAITIMLIRFARLILCVPPQDRCLVARIRVLLALYLTVRTM